MTNLLPAAKNIGTTHITNGAYRLHPVEWNIGEAVGTLTAHCLTHSTTPHAVHSSPERLRDFQRDLIRRGVQLDWPAVRGY
ncbi:MAG: FAD-dependent oxidoreductase, partial [Actinomycetes bacterium]